MQYFIIILLILNLLSFIIYGVDKNKAIKNRYRISEKALLSFAIIAPFGCYIGMKLWHHKTKKWYFQLITIGLSLIHVCIYILIVLQNS